ncbi:hypothetical protein [Streptomyces indicus]|uniref:hypothetical protein n=1 Tax=Streptomyces indicus TaxID=417292 RepID=UPI00115FFE1D|nr:hypothetical protein [Streptomyces indicus]
MRGGPGSARAGGAEEGTAGPEKSGGGLTPERAVAAGELSVAQVSGSALGVVSGALLASALGLFGTVVGAVVFSLTATVGGAAIQVGLQRGSRRYRALRRPAGRRRRGPSAGGGVHDPHLAVGERHRLAVPVGVDRRFHG